MGKEIICKSCGASFDEALVRCPYCGTAYLPAEEQEHMEKLEEIRQDLREYEKESVKKPGKKLVTAIFIALLVIVAIVLFVISGIWSSGLREKEKSQQRKDDFLKNQGITTELEEPER